METFKGISRAVSGSNGLIQDLLEAWILIGESLESADDNSELIAFLKNRSSLGDGGRSWNVAPSNSELKRFADWKLFAQILSECAAQLSLENSQILAHLNRTNCLSPSNQDREHSIFLMAWNLDFLDLINESLAATGFPPVEPKQMQLTVQEWHEVQLNKLLARKRDLKRLNETDRHIAALEHIIQLLRTELPEKRRQLSDCLQEKGELLQSCHRTAESGSAYRAAIEVEPEADLKHALIEFVEETFAINENESK